VLPGRIGSYRVQCFPGMSLGRPGDTVTTTLDDRLLPVFCRQHWLVSLADVIVAGGSQQAASRRVQAGRWEQAERAVYRLVGPPVTWESRVLSLVLSTGDGAVASHFAAAALHGIPGIGKGTPEISIPRGREKRRSDARVHTSTDLDRCDHVMVDGIPCTDIDRTLLDLARRLGHARLLRAIEACRRAGTVDWSSLIRTLGRHARRGRPGIRRLRSVILANADRTEITDSDLELLALALLAEVGLPTPVVHHRVYDGDRFVAEVDLALPDLKIAIELDGGAHLDADVHERDLARQNDLILCGWTVLRFTWARLRARPESVAAEVRAAIAAASRRNV
jgi:hypothetical protein